MIQVLSDYNKSSVFIGYNSVKLCIYYGFVYNYLGLSIDNSIYIYKLRVRIFLIGLGNYVVGFNL